MHVIKTTAEAWQLAGEVPEEVLTELIRGAAVLEAEYGDDGAGGYAIVMQSAADMEEAKDLVDYSTMICEWATRMGDSGYLSALYILDNEFSVVLYMPISLAPDNILLELED